MNRAPQIIAVGAAVAVLLLVALYVARPHQMEVSSPSARGPTAARSVYPSIAVDPTWTPAPSPDTTPRILDLQSGDVEALHAPSDLTFASVLSDGSLLFTSGTVLPGQVIARDGSVIAMLHVLGTQEYRLSIDRRYVVWLSADNRLQVYDAVTNDVGATVPPNLRFEHSTADRAILVPGPAGSALVELDGTVEKTIAAADWQVAISTDGQRLAWLEPSGLHSYDRATRVEPTNKDVQWANASLAWSPDATKMAYERLTGDNALHVEMLNIASGTQREVYAGAPDVRLERLRFVSAHRIEFHVKSGDFARFGDVGGARYQVNDDGADGVLLDQPGTEWDYCGPKCGLPPDDYESAAGIALWCQRQVDKTCVVHTVYVDRAGGRMHELVAGYEFAPVAVSPDRMRLAIAIGAENQIIRVINLEDLTERDVAVLSTFANNLTWLDGGSLLLTWVGGN